MSGRLPLRGSPSSGTVYQANLRGLPESFPDALLLATLLAMSASRRCWGRRPDFFSLGVVHSSPRSYYL